MGIIQDNAIRSWSRLRPAPKIILFGPDSETGDIAHRVQVDLVPDVAQNSHGTPLLSDMFGRADSMAAGDVLAFVSADVILDQSLIAATRIVASWSEKFLLVAQRRDVDVRQPLDFGVDRNGSMGEISARSHLHSPGAIDLFVYRRGQYAGMPPFAIGRTAYDNWLLWNTVASGIPLVDATDYVMLLHQNHDYLHRPAVDVWYGVEALENRSWIKHWTNYYTIVHANWQLTAQGKVVPATAWKYRMARPRQVLSHALRPTRRLRTRLKTWRSALRYGS
ncbi:MAG TPA: hypothetical protein VLK30_13390 [Candidatus Limnocylindrales bacterium]|nr:hypothetical protein [Candidatus Limnocylindrales bacterium]